MPLTDLHNILGELNSPTLDLGLLHARDCLLMLWDGWLPPTVDIFSSEDQLRSLLTTFQQRQITDDNCEKVLRTLQAFEPGPVESKLADFLILYMRDCVARHMRVS